MKGEAARKSVSPALDQLKAEVERVSNMSTEKVKAAAAKKRAVRKAPAKAPAKKAVSKKLPSAPAKKPLPKKPAGRVAQRTEQRTSKAKVAGSTPAPAAKPKAKTKSSGERGTAPDRVRKKSDITATPEEPKRSRGRPPTGFDKGAYQRDYMREYRAAVKAEKAEKGK